MKSSVESLRIIELLNGFTLITFKNCITFYFLNNVNIVKCNKLYCNSYWN